MAKAGLSYILHVHENVVPLLYVFSLSEYFLCELSKDCNKNIPQMSISSYLFTFNLYSSVFSVINPCLPNF